MGGYKFSSLLQSARDMRDALTAEVADKHDSIRALRREQQALEEQCRQIDKQAHFKDDIIKELRKEIRNIKKVKIYALSIVVLSLSDFKICSDLQNVFY